MPTWLWWTLAGTVFLAVIITFVTFFITRAKINKVRDTYLAKMNDPEEIAKEFEAYQRENHGMLLWEEKNKAKNPLEDEQLEFAINTIIRNKYESVFIKGAESDYEAKSLKKLAKAKIVEEPGHLNILFNSEKMNNEFDKIYKSIKPNSMIMIANSPKKDKEVKRLMRYLKTSKMRHEWQPVGKGIILVVK